LYRPFDPKHVRDNFGAPSRYAVYTLGPSGDIGYADLGEASAIDDLVERFRAMLADPAKDPAPLARALDERVGRPLRSLAGGAHEVLLAPDGALNLVPFGALIDERGRYLLGDYAFAYLTTGRDLSKLSAKRAGSSEPVVVADPDFGPSGFATPLPGTKQEGRAVAALLPSARTLMGRDATKGAIEGLHSPRVLHIATHGFFKQEARAAGGAGTAAGKAPGFALDSGRGKPTPASDNPLLFSGLVFAGANRGRADDNGLLTALEASGLDLWGTKLVVLSACETGVGEVRRGEGVYGLRRAMVLAGAETVVMSLWKVDDEATKDLMLAYYAGLQNGGGRTEALREAQLAIMASRGRAHPFYWASFISLGDDRSMDGAAAPVRRMETKAPDFARVRGRACGCQAIGGGDDGVTGAGALLLVGAIGLVTSRRLGRNSRRDRRSHVALVLASSPPVSFRLRRPRISRSPRERALLSPAPESRAREWRPDSREGSG
jgi:CHAT domain-containing protein